MQARAHEKKCHSNFRQLGRGRPGWEAGWLAAVLLLSYVGGLNLGTYEMYVCMQSLSFPSRFLSMDELRVRSSWPFLMNFPFFVIQLLWLEIRTN